MLLTAVKQHESKCYWSDWLLPLSSLVFWFNCWPSSECLTQTSTWTGHAVNKYAKLATLWLHYIASFAKLIQLTQRYLLLHGDWRRCLAYRAKRMVRQPGHKAISLGNCWENVVACETFCQVAPPFHPSPGAKPCKEGRVLKWKWNILIGRKRTTYTQNCLAHWSRSSVTMLATTWL